MRVAILVLITSLTFAASSSAVKLETAATVELVEPATADLAQWNDDNDPTWSLTGAPHGQVQLSLELRTQGGRQIAVGADRSLSLDPTGQILTTLAPPIAGPHATASVLTLVICRE